MVRWFDTLSISISGDYICVFDGFLSHVWCRLGLGPEAGWVSMNIWIR